MPFSLKLQGSVSRWILLFLWFALPWVIVFGLQSYGESVPQSVRMTTVNLAGFYSFLACGLGGVVLIFQPKERRLPRLLIGFVSTLSILIGLAGFPKYTCGPKFVQSVAERQQQAASKSGQATQASSGKKTGESCS